MIVQFFQRVQFFDPSQFSGLLLPLVIGRAFSNWVRANLWRFCKLWMWVCALLRSTSKSNQEFVDEVSKGKDIKSSPISLNNHILGEGRKKEKTWTSKEENFCLLRQFPAQHHFRARISVANLYKGCLKHFYGENLVATYETMDIFEICIATHSHLKTLKAKSILDHQIGNRY